MPTNLRLKDKELDAIENASLVINKLLIEKGIQPVGTTGIAHMLLEVGIDMAKKQPELFITGN